MRIQQVTERDAMWEMKEMELCGVLRSGCLGADEKGAGQDTPRNNSCMVWLSRAILELLRSYEKISTTNPPFKFLFHYTARLLHPAGWAEVYMDEPISTAQICNCSESADFLRLNAREGLSQLRSGWFQDTTVTAAKRVRLAGRGSEQVERSAP